MAIWSLTQERVEKLQDKIGDKELEIDALTKLTPRDLWTRDLDAFVEEWNLQIDEEGKRKKKIASMTRRASQKLGFGASKGGKRKKKRAGDDSDSDEFSDYGPAKKKAKPKTGGLLSYLKTEPEEAKKTSATTSKAAASSMARQSDLLTHFKKPTPPVPAEPETMDIDTDDVKPEPAPAAATKRGRLAGSKNVKKPTPPVATESEHSDIDFDDLEPEPAPVAATKRGRTAGSKTAKKPTPAPVDPDSDSDVFAAVAKEPAKKKPAESIPASRTARGAAKKATNYAVDRDSESDMDNDDDDFDLSMMVKTIGNSGNDRPLFNAGTARSSIARPAGPSKLGGRAGATKTTILDDDDSMDVTNYEALVPRSSPEKMASRSIEPLDTDEEDDLMLSVKKAPPVKSVPKAKTAAKSKAPAASTVVAKKTTALSPAAKAYAARLGKTKDLAPAKPAAKAKKAITIDSDEDEDITMDDANKLANDILSEEEDDEPIVKPKRAAARPGRRAAAKPAKYVLSDDDDDSEEPSEASFDDDSD